MATREDYRLNLLDKLLGLEDGGYGDFEYADTELDTYLSLVVAALFPSLYVKASEDALTVAEYGNLNYGQVTLPAGVPEERVYLVEDSTELTPMRAWSTRPGKVVQIDDTTTQVNVYYYTAYELPADDVTDAGIPTEYTPLIVLGALIEAMESRHDTGLKPTDPQMGYQQTSLIDRLNARYERLKGDLAMSLPVRIM